VPPRQLTPPTRAFVAAVVASGAGAFAWLLAAWDPTESPAWPALIFGPLAVASVSVGSGYRGSMPSATTFQLGTAFVFALFLVSGPAPAAVVAGTMSAIDWARSRRSPVVGAFNLGQMFLSAGVGAGVAEAMGGHPLWSGTAAILAFSLTNHALTHLVVSLSGRRPILSRPEALADGARAEILCVASGLTMGLVWPLEPWYALIAAVPLLAFAGLLRELARRQESLDRRDRERRALEDVAAALSENSRGGIRGAITRDVARSFDAAGALLAALEGDGRSLRVLAAAGVALDAPASIPVSRFADGFFETRTVRRVEDLRHDGALYPELAFLGSDFAGGALAVPLRVGPEADGLLVVIHGAERRPFDDDDARRLDLLARLVEPALREMAPR
jgi:hypothetical protein